MNKSILSLAVAALATLAAGSASAFATYSGFDINNSDTLALASTPGSSGAENSFKTGLVGATATENFEGGIAAGSGTPLSLNFGAAVGTATLSGGAGTVTQVAAGSTNGFGRYSVPGGTKYFDVAAGGTNGFLITFSQEIQALGFYGIDIGDFDGTVVLDLMDDTNTIVGTWTLPTAASRDANGNVINANGSVVYFGVIAGNTGEGFKSARFSTAGAGNGLTTDRFGFDSFTVGAFGAPSPVPEPATLALIGAALLGFGLSRRRQA